MDTLIEFDQLTKLRDFSDVYSQIDDSYLCSHIAPGSGETFLSDGKPMKINGILVVLVCKGSTDISINFENYTLGAGSLMVLAPSNVVNVVSAPTPDVEAYMLFFDMKFLQGVNINLTSVALPDRYSNPKPVIELSEGEMNLLTRYFDLFYLNTKGRYNLQFNKNIATSLIAAMFYQIVEFHHKRIGVEVGGRTLSRRHDYVRDFIKLVHVHYLRERSVAFYASKLFISPKYLSLLVKEATGRSAAAWIDEFVIMEAKNMLKFSGKNIQQVAYALNFSTQSSFGKYFKHITGMSPTEYQKS